MSEVTAQTPEKREEALKVLGEILGHMELPAKLDAKDAADGAISIAVQLEEALPGVAAGKRSPFSDALQYLINKRVNRPGAERRHVLVGIGSHPEPRGPKPARPQPPAQTSPAAPPNGPAAAAPPPAQRAARPAAPASAPAAAREGDERSMNVELPAPFAQEVRRMAEASAKLGRYFALVGLGSEDRARVVQAASGAAGVGVKVEGEGRNRRVVFTPEKPVPMPRQMLPVDDFDDEEA